jgi:mannose-1-phosphate guanylyltransferase
MTYGVILAGGKGERFWPMSRNDNPKQLLRLTSASKTMIEETIERLKGFVPADRIIVVTGSHLEDKILGAVPLLKKDNLLLEPRGKNTCLAVGLAAVHILKKDPEGVMVILSSDHMISPTEKLVAILKAGVQVASEENCLITIGVVPTRAETAYGYIELGEDFRTVSGLSFSRVKKFKEKPSPSKAQEYYLDRRHLWNSGMFIWRADFILAAIEEHIPDMYRCLLEYEKSIGSAADEKARGKLYQACTDISVDFAVLEKASNVVTVRGDIRWDDIGSWLAMGRIHERDAENNVNIGDVVLEGCYENIIMNDSDGIVVGLGVSDLVVVRSGDVFMVAHKTRVDEIKNLLARLAEDDAYKKHI